MKNNNFNRISNLAFSIVLIISLSSCDEGKNTRNDTGDLMARTEKLEQDQQKMEQILAKAEKAKDSLLEQQEFLIQRKKEMEGNIRKLDSLQSAFTQIQREERQEELSLERANLQSSLTSINDSLKSLSSAIAGLNSQLDTLNVAEKQLSETRERVDTRLVTGISEIDIRLNQLEVEAMTKNRQMDFEEQKLTLASNKIEILEEEKIIYQREKNSLMDKGGEEEKIEDFEKKIQEVNQAIQEERSKVDQAQENLVELTSWMSDYRTMQNRLKEAIAQEYSRTEILTDFTQSEIDRLNNQKSEMKDELQNLQSIQQELKIQKSEIDSSLTHLDEEIGVVKSQELSDLLMKKSELGSEEAELLEEESALLSGSSGGGDNPPFTGISETTSGLISELDQDIRAQRAEIEKMKEQISLTKMELAQKQAQIDERRANNAKAARISIITILLVGAGVLLLLYFLGRARRTAKA